jgi:hypothetical protein
MATRKQFNQFFDGYVTAALWSSNDESDESGGEPLDKNYDRSDIAKDSLRKMKQDCVKFMRANKSALAEAAHEMGWPSNGHDFWLTRNGHGAGFWDRGLGDLGDRLSEACKKFPEQYLYVGDDKQIHVA